MARRKTILRLPPLHEVFPDFSGFADEENRQQIILAKVREAAEALRESKPQIFYAMREIADFFAVSLRTVALVYESLEKEGVLNRIRGSHTLLAGRESAPRFSVRGIVGIPIWIEMMVLSAFTRQVNMQLEEKLRRRGFVADLIFHGTKKEETHPDFSERLLRHQLDIVIWQNPDPRSRQNILALRNFGIRILAIQTTEAETDLPVISYLQDWRPAYRMLGHYWRTEGVRKVLLPIDPANLAYGSEFQIFKILMEDTGLQVELCSNDAAETLRRCRLQTGKRKVAVGFLEMQTADRFCNHEPFLVEQIAEIAAIGFCRGQLRAPYLQGRGIRPAVVAMSASEISTRIVEDIQNLPRVRDGVRHTFEARCECHSEFDSAEEFS